MKQFPLLLNGWGHPPCPTCGKYITVSEKTTHSGDTFLCCEECQKSLLPGVRWSDIAHAPRGPNA